MKQKRIAVLLGVVAVSITIAVAVALRKGPGVDVYLVKSGSVDSSPNDVVLEDEPWIACEDIERYDGSTHCIYLKKDVRLAWPKVALKGTPFAVTVGGSPCYLGAFWALESSFAPQANAVIYNMSILSQDVVRIERSWDRDADEVRDDPRIIRALRNHGQYRAGLECSLDKVVVSAKTGSLTYTYTLRNLDREPLYVLDPDRLGAARFHYFTNGVGLLTDSDSIWPKISAADPRGGATQGIDEAWFFLLRGGKSMSRTVVLGGYPTIPPGTYDCLFVFPSPAKVRREHRRLPDGRVWLGQLQAERTIEVVAE